MAFKPGQLKPSGSGRKRGTPNKKSTRLAELFEDEGLNVAAEIKAAIRDRDCELLAALSQFLPYIVVKLKEQEVSRDDAIDVTPEDSELTDAELLQLANGSSKK